MDSNSALILILLVVFIIKKSPPTTTSSPSVPPPVVVTPPPTPPPTQEEPDYPIVSIPPVTTPAQSWFQQARNYKNSNPKGVRFPLLNYYFPVTSVIKEQVQEELQDNQLPTEKKAVLYGVELGFLTAGIDSKQEFKEDLQRNVGHIKSDIRSGKMTPTNFSNFS